MNKPEALTGYLGEDSKQEPEYQFDFNSMELSAKLLSVHQEGNYLVGTTTQGIKFKQRIPAGKILNKNEKGEFVLTDMLCSDI